MGNVLFLLLLSKYPSLISGKNGKIKNLNHKDIDKMDWMNEV